MFGHGRITWNMETRDSQQVQITMVKKDGLVTTDHDLTELWGEVNGFRETVLRLLDLVWVDLSREKAKKTAG
jgi:hypothetical protein